jgi:hypothetical protein
LYCRNSAGDIFTGNDHISGRCLSAKGKSLNSYGEAKMGDFSASGTAPSDEIEVIMRPHPDALQCVDADSYTRFLKTTSNATGTEFFDIVLSSSLRHYVESRLGSKLQGKSFVSYVTLFRAISHAKIHSLQHELI